MKILFPIIFVLIIIFLQIGIFPHLSIYGAYPDLILIAVLSLIILMGLKKTLIWIIAAGLFMDFYSLNNFLGFSVLILLISCLVVFFISQNIFKKTSFSSIIFIFLISILINNLIVFAAYKVLGMNSEFGLRTLIVNVLYNTIIAIPFFYLFKIYVFKFFKV